MTVYTIKRYTRELIQSHQDKIFVFGDNLYRTGYGGQAGAARDEENTLGIITKFSPASDHASFFNDSQLNLYKELTINDFTLLEMYNDKDSGFDLVIPYDGIGTGLSDLQNKAPKILEYIEQKFFELIIPYEYKFKMKSFEDFCYFKHHAKNNDFSDFVKLVRGTAQVYHEDRISYPYANETHESLLPFFLQHTDRNKTNWRDFALKFEEHF